MSKDSYNRNIRNNSDESYYYDFSENNSSYMRPHKKKSFRVEASPNNDDSNLVVSSGTAFLDKEEKKSADNYYLDLENDENLPLRNNQRKFVTKVKWDKLDDMPEWRAYSHNNSFKNNEEFGCKDATNLPRDIKSNINNDSLEQNHHTMNRPFPKSIYPIGAESQARRLEKNREEYRTVRISTNVENDTDNLSFNKEKKSSSQSLINGGMILIFGLILSKISGQVREILYGNVFQESYLTDAYVKAFLIPDFIYDLLIGGSIQAAIIPTLSSSIGTNNEKKAWKSVNIFISIMALSVLILIIIGEIFAPILMRTIATPEYIGITTSLARTLFPQTFFMMLAALSIGIVNSHKKFKKTAFGPTIYNLAVILALYFLGDSNEAALIRVGVGITFGTLFYFLFQYTLGYKELSKFRFSLDYRDKDFIKLLILAIPTMFSSSISQLSNMITYAFTRELVDGSSTALRYATSVWLLPYGIFTVGIGQAMLPTLSEFIGRKKYKSAALALRQSMRHVLFFIIPSAIIFFFFRYEIMHGIFAWGKLSESRTMVINMSAEILSFYCVAMVFQSIIYIMNFSFYSLKRTAIPLYSGLLSLLLMFILALPLSRPDSMGARGLSLAYALSSLIMALALLVFFSRLYPKLKLRRMSVFLIQEGIASVALLLVILLLNLISSFISFDHKLLQLVWIGLKSLIAYGVYFYVCDFIFMPEPRKFLKIKPRKLPNRS